MWRIDIGALAAMVWLAIAVFVSLVFGPLLGLRGWAWLAVHHALCIVGCTHELVRASRRRARAREEADQRLKQAVALSRPDEPTPRSR